MDKKSEYAKNIFFSLIISVLILLGIGFLSVKYLIPIYDLKSQDIYKFMIYLLPIIIGLTFVEIGSMIASKNNEAKDNYDQLPINSYDEPFYAPLNDDPLHTHNAASSDINFSPVKKHSEDLEYQSDEFHTINASVAYPSDLDDEIQRQLLSLDAQKANEALDFVKEDYNYFKSNLNPDLTNQLLSLNEEDAKKILYWLSQDVVLITPDSLDSFDEEDNNAICEDLQNQLLNLSEEDAKNALYWLSQAPSIKDSNSINNESVELPFDNETNQAILNFSSEDAHKAVDYISRGLDDIDILEKYSEKFDSSIDSILNAEISNANDLGYDISFAVLNADNREDIDQINLLLANINSSCYNFENKDGSIYLIFPLYTKEEAKAILNKNFEKIFHNFKFGITSINERYDINIQEFINEAIKDFNSK